MPRPRTVDADKIVQTALAIADEEGIDAVSMRHVGQRLGVAAQALYRHVANKDELLARMADHHLSRLPAIGDQDDWRAALVDLFTALRDLMLEHHGLAELMLQRTTGTPTMLDAAEKALAAMAADGIPARQAVTTLAMLQWSALGSALHGAARAGRPADELPPAIASANTEAYPALARARGQLTERVRREQFRDGLRQLLAGL